MKSRVQDWMTSRVLSTSPDDPLYSAVELMAETGIRHVLVLEGGKLAGILSNRDLVRASLRDPRVLLDLHTARVGEVMTRAPLTTTEPEVLLIQAADLMHSKKVNALPVMDGEKVIGILSSDDVLFAVSQSGLILMRPDL